MTEKLNYFTAKVEAVGYNKRLIKKVCLEKLLLEMMMNCGL